MRLGIASALPPDPTGPADYVANMLPKLKEHAELVCFTTHPAAVEGSVSQYAEIRGLDELATSTCDLLIYHIANNIYQKDILESALNGPPGLLVIHDASVHHLAEELLLNRGSSTIYTEFLERAHGEEGRRLATLRTAAPAGRIELFLFDLLAPILDRHLGAVVHNVAAEQIVRMRCPQIPIWVIPHFAPAPAFPKTKAQMGLPESGMIVGHFGYVTIPKRPILILEAAARALADGHDVHVLFAGTDHTQGALDESINRLGLQERVTVTGFLSHERMDDLLTAVDAVVSLRSPHIAESSGTLAAAMSNAKPLIVQDVGSWVEIPREAAIRITPDLNEAATLAHAIAKLCASPETRESMGEAAVRYASSMLGLDRCVALLMDAARSAATLRAGDIDPSGTRDRIVKSFLSEGPEGIKECIAASGSTAAIKIAEPHLKRYATTLQELPPAAKGSTLLDIGSLPALLRIFHSVWGYEVTACNRLGSGEPVSIDLPPWRDFPELTVQLDAVDVERDSLPYPAGHFDVVTCWEVLEHLRRDPMHMLWEINRVLKANGILFLTTPNVTSTRAVKAVLAGFHPYHWSQYLTTRSSDRHNREYAPAEIRWLLEKAGFSSDEVKTKQVWEPHDPITIDLLERIGAPVVDRGDNILAVARKVSLPRERFPKEFYS